MLAYLACRSKGPCIVHRAEPIPLLRASGSLHLGSSFCVPSGPVSSAGSELPLSPFRPIAHLGDLVTDWVHCWQWRVWLFTRTKPVWLVSTLCSGCLPSMEYRFVVPGPVPLAYTVLGCGSLGLFSYPIIQLTPETYPDVRFSAFATNQHEGLKAMVEAPWKFLVSCSPLGDLGRTQRGGRNTWVFHWGFVSQPALYTWSALIQGL